ncbi:MAG: FAD-dependent oxidoreductase [Euryarchaeota archaeon]|nr:FAD-dependent oxidoreductase [Euryarchaeota archaeon]
MADETPPTDQPDESSLPGEPASIWLATNPVTEYDSLTEPRSVDVAVCGGGIVGLTAAKQLADAGLSVAVLERDRIVTGVTGHSTAKLTTQHGLKYDSLRSKHGPETARQYAAANRAAIEHVAGRIDQWDVDCGFERRPAIMYTEQAGRRSTLRDEREAAWEAGISATADDEIPFSPTATAGVRFDEQAQYDPRAYLLELGDKIESAGGQIYENTAVTGLSGSDPYRVETSVDDSETTADGEATVDDRAGETEAAVTVDAEQVILATHFPIRDRLGLFARLYPKQSYVLAARTAGEQPEGMYYRVDDPYFSVRSASLDGESLTLIGGQNHKTGQGGDTADRYRALEREARDHFAIEEIVYRWSTQDYASVDGIPYVGHGGPLTDDLYIATGFGGWGMSNGVAAGLQLADMVRGRETPWQRAFDPRRVTVQESAGKLLTETANEGGQFIRGWMKSVRSEPSELRTDEAAIYGREGKPIAAYRDPDGELHTRSAICPHMGCVVDFNPAERSWDCPCHGSRFHADGEVFDGPAIEGLSTIEDLKSDSDSVDEL